MAAFLRQYAGDDNKTLSKTRGCIQIIVIQIYIYFENLRPEGMKSEVVSVASLLHLQCQCHVYESYSHKIFFRSRQQVSFDS